VIFEPCTIFGSISGHIFVCCAPWLLLEVADTETKSKSIRGVCVMNFPKLMWGPR
jgi:hypothetical protein